MKSSSSPHHSNRGKGSSTHSQSNHPSTWMLKWTTAIHCTKEITLSSVIHWSTSMPVEPHVESYPILGTVNRRLHPGTVANKKWMEERQQRYSEHCTRRPKLPTEEFKPIARKCGEYSCAPGFAWLKRRALHHWTGSIYSLSVSLCIRGPFLSIQLHCTVYCLIIHVFQFRFPLSTPSFLFIQVMVWLIFPSLSPLCHSTSLPYTGPPAIQQQLSHHTS